MENILNKNIFDERDLKKLSPEYTPHNVVLRMQMRRALVKDTHNHRIHRSTTWTRESIKKNKNSYNINKEIVKLRHSFNNINLKNRLTLKGPDTLKIKSETYDEKLLMTDSMESKLQNEVGEYILLPELPDENELEIRNDNEFKLNTKMKPKRIRFSKETPKDRKLKMLKGELIGLNKDINENNEDMFRVACTHKLEDPLKNEEHEKTPSKSDYKDSVLLSPRPVGDLQKLLVMMALTSKPTKDDEENDENNISNGETPRNELCYYNFVEKENMVSNSGNCEGIDNILSITPLKVKIRDKEKFIMEKYVEKWKNYVNKRKKYMEEQRQATLNSFLDKIAKKKMDIHQSHELQNKAHQHLRDYNTYQHRYKVQKHIIALQKAKLEEQNRLIEELKYNKIIDASRQSVDDMREEVRRTYYEIDRQLKPRIKTLTKELKITDIEEPALVLHCLKMPQFLQRMEKRAREREEKHAMIRERRRQMEEDRIRIKQQMELAKAEMDKEEKVRRMKELKEKRKRERIETIRKKQWAERLRGLIVMADLHYEKTLVFKYGIAPLRKLIEIKRDSMEKARAHYRFQLKKNVFFHWMWYTEDMWYERNFKAENFYRKTLLRKTFKGFKMIHHKVILKNQVADDYYDLYVTHLGFRMLREGLMAIRKEQESKWQKAVNYHNSNLLFKSFTCWRTLPALNALKREQDARKKRWREKVLQVVPDYSPPDD
ncbi:unnamed protein product [Arctia plantaginis]|uniref:Uncharacterized protein n=1 Tax=Arctia plantaginis TaxID=874455 RepID=A0A8S1AFF8_ARCPL|nr:unnamed protein product [Arctia plantaginis]CAB3247869.1 unnamed protein product [Arctia plantaginis]